MSTTATRLDERRTQTGTVLVVDDVTRNLQLLGGILSPHYEVMFATHGTAALERAAARVPDLVLLDMMMPGMDGLEVCRRLRADPRTMDSPVIFLTAAHESELAAQALACGAVDFVAKPFHTAELLARVRTHIELKQTRDELRRIIAEKSELMSVVAHDLKNPISAVRFSALLLRDGGLRSPDPRGELVDEIANTCGQMLEFIAERLEQSARASLPHGFDACELPLGDALEAVVHENRRAAHAKNISLVLGTDPAEAPIVRTDPRALKQVLGNLVSNAIKFSPPDSTVHIAAELAGGENTARVTVRDEGPGLTDDDRTHLFEPYRRLSAKPTAGESSTGLGLSIARDLVQKMGGQIGCDSRPGEGAHFWFTLPAA